MADRVLFISWGQVVRGREERSLEVFNESMGLYGRMQQDGRIESFDVCLLTPNSGIAGYIQLNGSAEQIAAVRQDDEFLRNMNDAFLIVDDLAYTDGMTAGAIADQMARYQEAVSKVAQTA